MPIETHAILLREEDYPSALYPDELQCPLQVIERFFKRYTLSEVQRALWNGLSLQVTDEIKPSPAQRYELFRLGNELDRLVDAAWLLAKGVQEVRLPDNPSMTAWIETDVLSFISPAHARNPLKCFRKLFKRVKLHRWKTLAIYGRQEALLDPLYWMRCNSMALREFAEYVGLNKLVKAAFLLTEKAAEKESPDSAACHWSLWQKDGSDCLEWGRRYFARKNENDILGSLTFLYHYRQWGQEWHPAAAYRLYTHFGEIYRLLHTADALTRHGELRSSAGSSAHMIDKLRLIFQENPVGKLGRFLVKGILNSWAFRNVSDCCRSGSDDFKRIAWILDLTAAYFKSNIKTERYEHPEHQSLSFFR